MVERAMVLHSQVEFHQGFHHFQEGLLSLGGEDL